MNVAADRLAKYLVQGGCVTRHASRVVELSTRN